MAHAVTVPLPTADEVSPDVAQQLTSLPQLNVWKMFARTDDMFGAIRAMVHAVFTATGVDVRLRELIVVRTAYVLNVPYEMRINLIFAKNAGLTDVELRSLRTNAAQAFSGIDAVICRATDQMAASASSDDDTLASLLSEFGPNVTTKYIALIAWFNWLSRFVLATRIPEEPAALSGATSPL